MAELVTDCPRCRAHKITFELKACHTVGIKYNWQRLHEAFGICRHCDRATIFTLSDHDPATARVTGEPGWLVAYAGAVNNFVNIDGYIGLKDVSGVPPPEFLPDDIKAVFIEGATCLAAHCCNAAGTMFRLCVDLATRSKLPPGEAPGLNAKVRRDLGLRLPWLFDNHLLPGALKELSSCIKEDGNDGAHAGTLTKEDANDLLDFTSALLDRIYTEPERLRLAKERRDARRQPKGS